jgi:hypothetical protein
MVHRRRSLFLARSRPRLLAATCAIYQIAEIANGSFKLKEPPEIKGSGFVVRFKCGNGPSAAVFVGQLLGSCL